MKNFWYLFAGYAVVFVGIALYVFRIGRRTAELEEEIDELRERLGR